MMDVMHSQTVAYWIAKYTFGIKMKDASLILHYLDPVRVASGE